MAADHQGRLKEAAQGIRNAAARARVVADAVTMVRSMDWRIRSFSVTAMPPDAGHCFHTGAAPQRPVGKPGEP